MAHGKGAARRSAISKQDQDALNAGLMESRTLVECLAVDFAHLAAGLPGIAEDDVARIATWAGLGITRRMSLTAALLVSRLGDGGADALVGHASDTVRGWAAYMIAGRNDLPLAEVITALRPLADDRHFGVREWAWLAVRPRIVAQVDEAIQSLAGWCHADSDRLRRFASEATRPRGVWSAHIPALRRDPARALALLEPLRSDPSSYVRESVGNWLNDAAKDQPDWVTAICRRWQTESDTPATRYICKKALRSLQPR